MSNDEYPYRAESTEPTPMMPQEVPLVPPADSNSVRVEGVGAVPPYTQAPSQQFYAQAAPQQTYTQQGQPAQPYQPPYGVMPGKTRRPGLGSAKKEKWPAVVLAFALGSLGIHKFYLGYNTEGLVMLLVAAIGAVITLGIGTLVMTIISIIEAVKYIMLTEEDFEATYVQGYKGWF